MIDDNAPKLQEQRELISALVEELVTLDRVMKNTEKSIYQRSMVRMVFSTFDSTLNAVGNYLLCLLASSGIKYEKALLDIDGAAILLNVKRSKDGQLVKSYPTLEERILGLRRLSKYLDDRKVLAGKPLAEILSSKSQNFSHVKKARDNITHPKTLASLDVTPEAVTGLGNLMQWMMKIVKEVLSTTYQEEIKLSVGSLTLKIATDTGWLESPVRRSSHRSGGLPTLPDWVPPKNSA